MDLFMDPHLQNAGGLDMDVGTVQSPAVNVTMPGQKAGTPVPAAESKPLAPMGTCIGANGSCVRAFAPAHRHPYFMAIQGFVMLRDPCLFLEILTHHVRLSEE